ncbi:hypothetical protein [Microcoleus sp. K4-C2]|uniref:hypothetical protein n=1 Tax=Microcoleus sp. K4-C2 TaxID=2818792 RepID=UPI002FD43826
MRASRSVGEPDARSRSQTEYYSDVTGFDIQLISTDEFSAVTRSLAFVILFTRVIASVNFSLPPTDYFLNKI